MVRELSAVAGIVDRVGGLRVVVTQLRLMQHHVAPGERIYVVPGLEVEEPVSAEQAAALVSMVERHVGDST